jgi:hypothetical protein
MVGSEHDQRREGAAPGAQTGPVDPVAGKRVAEILGEIVWLMTQDPAGREMKVAEIETLVMPAILARRFHIKYAHVSDMRHPGKATLQPVAADIFALPRPSDPPARPPQVLAKFALKLGAS